MGRIPQCSAQVIIAMAFRAKGNHLLYKNIYTNHYGGNIGYIIGTTGGDV